VSSTGERSTPLPRRWKNGPIVGPSRAARTAGSDAANRPTVSIPRADSFFAVVRPIPHNASVGRSAITSTQLSAVSRNIPRGLPNPVAIFARSRLSPIPIEQCRPVAPSTAACTRAAITSGSGVCTPMNASSQPMTWTTASNVRRVSITSAEAAS